MSISIYQLKPRFQQLLRPALAQLARWHISPNQVTLLAMTLSLAYGAALALRPGDMRLWAGLPLFMLLRMALNAIDGMLANFTGQKSRLGAVLNELGDQISDAALVLPFALATGIDAPLLVVVALGALLVEFAGVLAVLVGAPRRFDGPMGKSDRAFAFGLLALLLVAGASPVWLNGLLCLVVLLLGWTLFNRLRSALRHGAPPTP
ncbi:CDP-alcohol phosphatidyltransferase family protein [Rhodoferax sp.]|uniref:CDP-alcohol phosphatidyltransferase family protein n=1 Tax=Rhodoferax sp. TaxID=50421 RepID=UPI00374CA392